MTKKPTGSYHGLIVSRGGCDMRNSPLFYRAGGLWQNVKTAIMTSLLSPPLRSGLVAVGA